MLTLATFEDFPEENFEDFLDYDTDDEFNANPLRLF